MNIARMDRAALLTLCDEANIRVDNPEAITREELMKLLRRREQQITAQDKTFTVPDSKTAIMVDVFVPAEKDPARNTPVVQTVNGNDWRIPRGVKVKVPDYIAIALEDGAVETSFVDTGRRNDDGGTIYSEIHTNRFGTQVYWPPDHPFVKDREARANQAAERAGLTQRIAVPA
jgi:hypothetical protein